MRDDHFDPERYGVSLMVVPSTGSRTEETTGWRAVEHAVAGGAGHGLLLCSDPSAVEPARSVLGSDAFRLDAVELPLDVRDYDVRHQRAFLHLAAHLLWGSLLLVPDRDYRGGYASLLENVVPRLCSHRDPTCEPQWPRVKPIARP